MVDEDDLVHAAASGGRWAFGQLWTLLAPTVAAYLRVRGVQDVDDVTSEVFLAVFARVEGFTGGGREFRRFLFTVAHHKSVDDIRRRFGSHAYRLVPVEQATDTPRTPSAEDAVLAERLSPRLHAAVNALPEAQREVLLLRVVADLDVASVAEVLDRSAGSVKQLQHRALVALRRELNASPQGNAMSHSAQPPADASTSPHPYGATRTRTVTGQGRPPITTTT